MAQTREINTQPSNLDPRYQRSRSVSPWEKNFNTPISEIAARNRAGFMACRKVLNVSRGDKKACPISQVWREWVFIFMVLPMAAPPLKSGAQNG
jgi:hypothetical protein